ncbi:hypothetical protein Tco_0480811 [Tanacetum coccineum]
MTSRPRTRIPSRPSYDPLALVDGFTPVEDNIGVIGSTSILSISGSLWCFVASLSTRAFPLSFLKSS